LTIKDCDEVYRRIGSVWLICWVWDWIYG